MQEKENRKLTYNVAQYIILSNHDGNLGLHFSLLHSRKKKPPPWFPKIHYNIHSQSDKFHGNHHNEFSFHFHSLVIVVLECLISKHIRILKRSGKEHWNKNYKLVLWICITCGTLWCFLASLKGRVRLR